MIKSEKVAIIGTGISGMSVAWLLQNNYDITVYEKASAVGGHSYTVDVKCGNKTVPVDAGFIVFDHRNYPHLTQLFNYLGVDTQRSDMSFGLTSMEGLEYGGKSFLTLFAQPKNILNRRYLKMLKEILFFIKIAVKDIEDVSLSESTTLGEYIQKFHPSNYFMNYYLLPIGGSLWSSSMEQVLQFPAMGFLKYIYNHGLLSPRVPPEAYTVTQGSREYVKKITAPYKDKIKLNCGIKSVRRGKDMVEVIDEENNKSVFDFVIFASHADQTLQMISDATPEEEEILGSFPYQSNKVVVHSDKNFMPSKKAAWSSWNYLANPINKQENVTITYWMNRLQSLSCDRNIFVTLNPQKEIDKNKVFKEINFGHPVFSASSMQAQQRVDEIQGKNKYWFCGAYITGYGFHEEGLRSAINIAAKLGIKPPWRTKRSLAA